MDRAQRFTEGLDTKNLLKDRGGWEVLRRSLEACMHPEKDPKSVESRMNTIVGDVHDYDQNKILKSDNPQEQIDLMLGRLLRSLDFLNRYYQALRNSDLKFQFVIPDSVVVNAERRDELKNVPIDHFVFTRGISRHTLPPIESTMLSPMDKEGNKLGRNVNPNGIDNYSSEIKLIVDSPAFSPEVSIAIANVFGQALDKLSILRQALERTQKQFTYEDGLREVAQSNVISLRESMARLGTSSIDSVE